MRRTLLLLPALLLSVLLAAGPAMAGPYTDFDEGVTIAEINSWATGYLNYFDAAPRDLEAYEAGSYAQGAGVAPMFRTPNNAIGEADNSIVTLGDLYQEQIDAGVALGEITLTFDQAITNGGGYDFAVFENGFESNTGGFFAELGYVSVSTDGDNWALFPSISLTEGLVGPYGVIDSTDVYNLVGKHARYQGTGFDLDDLLDNEQVLLGLVDLSEINYVKVTDIPGSGDYLDSEGSPIYDAWVTWGSGGVDLDAVGVINSVPVPAAVWLLGSGLLGLIGIRRRTSLF